MLARYTMTRQIKETGSRDGVKSVQSKRRGEPGDLLLILPGAQSIFFKFSQHRVTKVTAKYQQTLYD
jgi:hypothetical protein